MLYLTVSFSRGDLGKVKAAQGTTGRQKGPTRQLLQTILWGCPGPQQFEVDQRKSRPEIEADFDPISLTPCRIFVVNTVQVLIVL